MTDWEKEIQNELKKITWQSGIRSNILKIIQREIKKAINETRYKMIKTNTWFACRGDYEIYPLKTIIAFYEKEYIKKALDRTNGNIQKTARLLEIARDTLKKKMKEYKIK